MPINPADVSTIRVGQLPNGVWSLSDKLAHEIVDQLNQGTVQGLADLIGDYLGTASSLAFNPTTVNDGEVLPATDSNEWILVGKGTFGNVGGAPDITTTEELNALTSNGAYWSLSVQIPINVELAGIAQTIRPGFTSTAPSENAVYEALAEKANIGDITTPSYQNVLNVGNVSNGIPVHHVSSFSPAETHISSDEIVAENEDSKVTVLASSVIIENANERLEYNSNSLTFTDKLTGYISKFWMLRTAAGFAEFHTDPNKPAGVYIFVTRDELASKANLVAGKVPSNELPSYVDDIIEGYLLSNVFYLESGHTTVIPAEAGKIYIDITTGQKNKEYRYSGSTYIQITNGLIASADDVPNGITNLYSTSALVMSYILTGISFATGGAITATDNILQAFGKIQKQLTDGFTGSNIRSLLGISTLSGSNTGDETTATLKTKIDVELSFALSDETSNLTVGNLISFRMPYAMTLSSVRISVNDAPTVSTVIVDVKESGVSIFSTLVSIDAGELTSVTAAVPAVISDTSLADDALITVSTTQIGSGNPGKGLKMTLKGKKT